ncbi:MAG: uridine kinase [Actinomycetota bacterium]|nr:uridine kinase [Actinomycetota bacterium]
MADLIAGARPGSRLRVAVDGAPAAGTAGLADRLIDPLRVRGRPALRVRAADFLRPASVRLEQGREDAESYRTAWLDAAGLRREVLDPFAASGEYLPTLWDAERDRATRASRTQASPAAVLLLDGPLLLDSGLPFDFAIHLWLGDAALHRRTDEALRWTLPAYAGYAGERHADVVIRCDDPRHPAVVVRRSNDR